MANPWQLQGTDPLMQQWNAFGSEGEAWDWLHNSGLQGYQRIGLINQLAMQHPNSNWAEMANYAEQRNPGNVSGPVNSNYGWNQVNPYSGVSAPAGNMNGMGATPGSTPFQFGMNAQQYNQNMGGVPTTATQSTSTSTTPYVGGMTNYRSQNPMTPGVNVNPNNSITSNSLGLNSTVNNNQPAYQYRINPNNYRTQ